MYDSEDRFKAKVETEKKRAEQQRRDPEIETHVCPVCEKEYERMKGSSMCCCSKECWQKFSGKGE